MDGLAPAGRGGGPLMDRSSGPYAALKSGAYPIRGTHTPWSPSCVRGVDHGAPGAYSSESPVKATPNVVCRRVADTRPVVMASNLEMPRWAPSRPSSKTSHLDESSVRNSQQAQIPRLPLSSSSSSAAKPPSGKLADVSHRVNFDIRIDDQAFAKFMCERNAEQPSSPVPSSPFQSKENRQEHDLQEFRQSEQRPQEQRQQSRHESQASGVPRVVPSAVAAVQGASQSPGPARPLSRLSVAEARARGGTAGSTVRSRTPSISRPPREPPRTAPKEPQRRRLTGARREDEIQASFCEAEGQAPSVREISIPRDSGPEAFEDLETCSLDKRIYDFATEIDGVVAAFPVQDSQSLESTGSQMPDQDALRGILATNADDLATDSVLVREMQAVCEEVFGQENSRDKVRSSRNSPRVEASTAQDLGATLGSTETGSEPHFHSAVLQSSEPPGKDRLRLSIDQLTEQVQGLLSAGGTNPTATMTSENMPISGVRRESAPLTSSLAHAGHREVERLVFAAEPAPKQAEDISTTATTLGLRTSHPGTVREAIGAASMVPTSEETKEQLKITTIAAMSAVAAAAATIPSSTSTSSGPCMGTSSYHAPLTAMPKRAGRQPLNTTQIGATAGRRGASVGSTGAERRGLKGQLQPSQQRVNRGESQSQRRKRLGLVDIPRAGTKPAPIGTACGHVDVGSSISGSSVAGVIGASARSRENAGGSHSSRLDGSRVGGLSEETVQIPTGMFRDTGEDPAPRSQSPEAANSGDEAARRKRPGGWYSTGRAQELAKNVLMESAQARKAQEEKERKIQDQLRRLEMAYKSRVNAGPPVAKANRGPSRPPQLQSPTVQGTTQTWSPMAASDAARTQGPGSRGTARPPVRRGTGGQARGRRQRRPRSAGAVLGPRRSDVGSGPAGLRPRESVERPRDSIDEVLPSENDGAWTDPETGHPSRKPRNTSNFDVLRSRLVASTSDSVPTPDIGNKRAEPLAHLPLAARLRSATLARARQKRQAMHEEFERSMEWAGQHVDEPHEPYEPSETFSDTHDLSESRPQWQDPPVGANEDFLSEISPRGAQTYLTFADRQHIADIMVEQRERRLREASDSIQQAPAAAAHVPPIPGVREAWREEPRTVLPPAQPAGLAAPASAHVPPVPGIRESWREEPRTILPAGPPAGLAPPVPAHVPPMPGVRESWREEPRTVLPAGPPSGLAARPPSRGGVSWEPLGDTIPPAYEQCIPEFYEQYEQLIPSRGPPSPSRGGRRVEDDEFANVHETTSSEEISQNLGQTHGVALAEHAGRAYSSGTVADRRDSRYGDPLLPSSSGADVPRASIGTGPLVAPAPGPGPPTAPPRSWQQDDEAFGSQRRDARDSMQSTILPEAASVDEIQRPTVPPRSWQQQDREDDDFGNQRWGARTALQGTILPDALLGDDLERFGAGAGSSAASGSSAPVGRSYASTGAYGCAGSGSLGVGGVADVVSGSLPSHQSVIESTQRRDEQEFEFDGDEIETPAQSVEDVGDMHIASGYADGRVREPLPAPDTRIEGRAGALLADILVDDVSPAWAALPKSAPALPDRGVSSASAADPAAAAGIGRQLSSPTLTPRAMPALSADLDRDRIATAASSATDTGNMTERSSATDRGNMSEVSSTSDLPSGTACRSDGTKNPKPWQARVQQWQSSSQPHRPLRASKSDGWSRRQEQQPATDAVNAAAQAAPAPLVASSFLPSLARTAAVGASADLSKDAASVAHSSAVAADKTLTPADRESSINSELLTLRRDMETTKFDIQRARTLTEKEAMHRLLQAQKQKAKRLYKQKQELINERGFMIQLAKEVREVDDLLDKALSLNVDQEVQRKMTQRVTPLKAEPASASSSVPSSAKASRDALRKDSSRSSLDTVEHSAQTEWEARESHLQRLRAELSEKKRAVQERKKQLQAQEEQRLLRELERVEEEAEKLRKKPSASEESKRAKAAAPVPAAATTVATPLSEPVTLLTPTDSPAPVRPAVGGSVDAKPVRPTEDKTAEATPARPEEDRSAKAAVAPLADGNNVGTTTAPCSLALDVPTRTYSPPSVRPVGTPIADPIAHDDVRTAEQDESLAEDDVCLAGQDRSDGELQVQSDAEVMPVQRAAVGSASQLPGCKPRAEERGDLRIDFSESPEVREDPVRTSRADDSISSVASVQSDQIPRATDVTTAPSREHPSASLAKQQPGSPVGASPVASHLPKFIVEDDSASQVEEIVSQADESHSADEIPEVRLSASDHGVDLSRAAPAQQSVQEHRDEPAVVPQVAVKSAAPASEESSSHTVSHAVSRHSSEESFSEEQVELDRSANRAGFEADEWLPAAGGAALLERLAEQEVAAKAVETSVDARSGALETGVEPELPPKVSDAAAGVSGVTSGSVTVADSGIISKGIPSRSAQAVKDVAPSSSKDQTESERRHAVSADEVQDAEPSTSDNAEDEAAANLGAIFRGSGAVVDLNDPVTRTQVVDGMTSELLEEMIDDSIQTAQGAEPPLRAPTPIARAALISDELIGDGASSDDSDAAAPSPSQRAGRGHSAGTIIADPVQEAAALDAGGSGSPTGSDAGSCSSSEPLDRSAPSTGRKGEPSPQASTAPPSSRTSDQSSLLFADEAESHLPSRQQLAPAKDTGPPPRPPSPPPDSVRSPVAVAASSGASDRTSKGRSREQTADRIVEELVETLVGEVWTELAERKGLHVKVDTSSGGVGRPNSTGDVTPASRQRATAPARSSASGSAASGGSSASTAVVADSSDSFSLAQFLDVVFKQLGSHDESAFIPVPFPAVENWFPAVMDGLRQLCTRGASETGTSRVSAPPPRGITGSGEAWCRLLADSLVEVASEENKSEQRSQGWRKLGLGESPLARFQGHQAIVPSKTWAQLRQRVEEVVKVGGSSRSPDGHDGDSDPAPHDVQAINLVNIDESIDALLEEEINLDEASWLDLNADVVKVKSQIVQLIFADLVDETAAEIRAIWSGSPTTSARQGL